MKTEVKINGKTVEIELTDAQIKQLQQESKPRIPRSIDEVEGRNFLSLTLFSTKERTEAMLALAQLIEIHAAIEQENDDDSFVLNLCSKNEEVWVELHFESNELLREFEVLYKGLIETVEKGL